MGVFVCVCACGETPTHPSILLLCACVCLCVCVDRCWTGREARCMLKWRRHLNLRKHTHHTCMRTYKRYRIECEKWCVHFNSYDCAKNTRTYTHQDAIEWQPPWLQWCVWWSLSARWALWMWSETTETWEAPWSYPTHTHTHIHAHTCTHTYKHTHTYTQANTFSYTQKFEETKRMCTGSHKSFRTCILTQIHTYTGANTHELLPYHRVAIEWAVLCMCVFRWHCTNAA